MLIGKVGYKGGKGGGFPQPNISSFHAQNPISMQETQYLMGTRVKNPVMMGIIKILHEQWQKRVYGGGLL